ncbi:alpha-2-macroglobulin family protein [Desertivirga xinjiangensis]|uniref:alpha-2-macroglobulin family protein n=1 Tax=Desertivirga xinjiangensis TaxID=539206 RepID=UPI00210E6A85|nr:alpha-2-macroglobulin family protein [Pedobacter xinjiangensis]
MKKTFITLLISFITINSIFAQKTADKYKVLITKIDSLAIKGLPKSALAEIGKLEDLARREKNTPLQIKATIYRITFMSYLEETALESIIARLKTDINLTAYPVRPVLESLLGELYWRYYQNNRYQFSKRSILEKPDDDFTRWDLKTIIREVSVLYKASLKETEKLQRTPLEALEGVLIGDTTTRYLRPTLYDLLAHRALDFFLHEEADLLKPKQPFTLRDAKLFAGSRDFINSPIISSDTLSTSYQGLKLLQDLSQFHLNKANSAALADVDLKRLEFVFRKSVHTDKDSLYVRNLRERIKTLPKSEIIGDALILLSRYYMQKDSLKLALNYAEQATLIKSGSLAEKNGRSLIMQIRHKEISVAAENVNLPDNPILVFLNYKNIQEVKYNLYKLTDKQFAEIRKLDENYERWGSTSVRPSKALLKYLSAKKGYAQAQFKIKDPLDYRKHTTEFALKPLTTGNYLLLTGLPGDVDSCLSLLQFKVTKLSYTSRVTPSGDIEVRTLNRETGEPLAHVTVSLKRVEYSSGQRADVLLGSGKSDKEGKFTYSGMSGSFGQTTISLSLADDSYKDEGHYLYGVLKSKSSPKDVTRTILFTDRHVYRPGQSVYFKGIKLVQTGASSSILVNEPTKVYLKDANGKDISSAELKTNEFGTFSGSFILPPGSLNGSFRIHSDNGSKPFQVEEYKRPSFTVEVDAVKESYRLDDSVMVKGRVAAFSGYGLSHANIAYRVVRKRTNHRRFHYYGNPNPGTEILSDTIETNGSGEFTVRFKALPEELPSQENMVYNFEISIDAMDMSGETHSAFANVAVSEKVYTINLLLPERLLPGDEKEGTVNSGSFKPGKGPLYIVDGRVFEDFKSLDPSEIAEIQVLKDASTTAIYGSRGASGVVLITTKNKNETNVSKADPFKVPIGLSNLNNQNLDGEVKVKVYSLKTPERTTIKRLWTSPDLPILSKDEFSQLFPYYEYNNDLKYKSWPVIALVAARQQKLNGEKKESLDLSFLKNEKSGVYKIEVFATNRTGDTCSATYFTSLIIQPDVPAKSEDWLIPVKTVVIPGKEAEFLVGTGIPGNILMETYEADQLLSSQWLKIGNKQELVKVPVNVDSKNLRFQFITVFQNRMMSSYHDVSLRKSARDLEIRFLTHRDKLLPGQKEQWKLQVKAKDKQAAEMLAGLYDASLDDVAQPDSWTANLRFSEEVPGYFRWNGGNFVQQANSLPFRYQYINSSVSERNYESLDLLGSRHFSGYNDVYFGYLTKLTSKAKHEAGAKMVPGDAVLNEVAVVGYGTQRKQDLTGAVSSVTAPGEEKSIMIRGTSSIVEDNSVYDFAAVPAPKKTETASIRKNFAETAFFYPHLLTNEKGEILIEFTIPEALTRWRFRAFAHTKDLQSGHIETEVVTQKDLMVSANTPRFFREGDTIKLSARIANLSKRPITGKVKLQLFNALNMQPVTLLVNAGEAEQNFEIGSSLNKSVSFKLVIPPGLDAITYRLTADAGKFSDGEENTIPVLPNAMVVTESMPMMVRAGQTKDFTFDRLLNNTSETLEHKTLTLEYTSNPAWYAVQALPYLMEFPYEGSEQTFSRVFANSLASNIVNKHPQIKTVFDQWKNLNRGALLSNLEKNQELKALLIEETPWLQQAANEAEQKKRVALLFDLNKMANEMQLNIEKLRKMQRSDGGFPWFAGSNYSDRYITQHILAGLGQLMNVKAVPDSRLLEEIGKEAMKYLDNEIVQDHKVALNYEKKHKVKLKELSYITLHALYVRSYFQDEPKSAQLKLALNYFLPVLITSWKFKSVYEQGLMAVVMHRNKDIENAKAVIRSLIERARQSDELGMYWPENKLGYYWYQSPIETQALLIEFFTETGASPKHIDEMKIWLLRNKQTTNWKTTKATALACYALLMRGDNWLASQSLPGISLGSKTLTDLKPGLKAEAGSGYIKTSWKERAIKTELGKVSLKNDSKLVNWGALHWQYLERLDKITSAETALKLERKYFIQKQTDAGPVLTAIDKNHKPRTGDLLKVVVYLNADRDYEYVQLKDMRPSGTEPVDVLSGYKYQERFYYYQVTKDVSTNFFINNLPKGKYVFEYRLRVVQSGNFSTGISSIQCLYAPEYNAHSEGERMEID